MRGGAVTVWLLCARGAVHNVLECLASQCLATDNQTNKERHCAENRSDPGLREAPADLSLLLARGTSELGVTKALASLAHTVARGGIAAFRALRGLAASSSLPTGGALANTL